MVTAVLLAGIFTGCGTTKTEEATAVKKPAAEETAAEETAAVEETAAATASAEVSVNSGIV